MSKHLSAIIFGVAIIISSIFLGNAYVDRNKSDGQISVTGLGKTNFTSDLIVWEGRFSTQNIQVKEAYKDLAVERKIITKYLQNKGVAEGQIVFKAVRTTSKTKRKYNSNGDYIGDEFIGYNLVQAIQIESSEVDKIEKISREITELINQGVTFYSDAPRFYYTKLADLKIQMISEATEDARIRAEKIAEYSGGNLGQLRSAKMGVFQITGQNSKEDYSWGGTFNTSSKEKTASITMKLLYQVK